jgi:hypothetical protein
MIMTLRLVRAMLCASFILCLTVTRSLAQTAKPVNHADCYIAACKLMGQPLDVATEAQRVFTSKQTNLSPGDRDAALKEIGVAIQKEYDAIDPKAVRFEASVNCNNIKNYDYTNKGMQLRPLWSPTVIMFNPEAFAQVREIPVQFDGLVHIVFTNGLDLALVPMSEEKFKEIGGGGTNISFTADLELQPVASRRIGEGDRDHRQPITELYCHIVKRTLRETYPVAGSPDPNPRKFATQSVEPAPTDKIGKIGPTGKSAFAPVADAETIGMTWQKIAVGQTPDFKPVAALDSRAKEVDEFTRPKVVQQIVDEYTKRYEALDPAAPFVISFQGYLNEYDGEKQAFTWNKNTASDSWAFASMVPFVKQQRNDGLVMPETIKYVVTMSNAGEFDQIKMPPDQARELSEKTAAATAKGSVEAILTLQPERAVGDDPNQKYLRDRTLVCRLVNLKLYSYMGVPLMERSFEAPAAPTAEKKQLDIGLDPANADIKGLKMGQPVAAFVDAAKKVFPQVVYDEKKPDSVRFANPEKGEEGGASVDQDGKVFGVIYLRKLDPQQLNGVAESLIEKYGKPISDTGRQPDFRKPGTVVRQIRWTKPGFLKPANAGVTAEITEANVRGQRQAVLKIVILLPGEHHRPGSGGEKAQPDNNPGEATTKPKIDL